MEYRNGQESWLKAEKDQERYKKTHWINREHNIEDESCFAAEK